MDFECVIHYIKALSNCFLNNFFDILVTATTFVLIYLAGYFYFKDWKNSNQNGSFSWESFQELHEAVIEQDMIRAIRSIVKCPKAINYLHPIDGYSPFMRACLQGNTQLVSIMLKFGADISLKSSKGETPFYLAIFYHIQYPKTTDATCIRALYYAGCDINASNKKGFTALQLAANFGHTNLVKWLLSKGASALVQPYPYTIARRKGHTDTAMLLRNLGLPAIE